MDTIFRDLGKSEQYFREPGCKDAPGGSSLLYMYMYVVVKKAMTNV